VRPTMIESVSSRSARGGITPIFSGNERYDWHRRVKGICGAYETGVCVVRYSHCDRWGIIIQQQPSSRGPINAVARLKTNVVTDRLGSKVGRRYPGTQIVDV
jgi:hypothetical protein